MMKFRENEEAVSPVIGVILMVAITVILAAVIAAFVFGMTDNVATTKTVAATATQQGETEIIVTYQGGPDAQSVQYLAFSIKEDFQGYSGGTGKTVGTTTEAIAAKVKVGDSWKFTVGTGDKDHVVVTAHFDDGADQVVLDKFV
ncbi:MAG: type IV pilin N-terminal domain-containing protein [Methanomicrobiaceae archaeon]|uniref:type IV pilin N-terminal domain-containing protein n=1 Tax=Methanoculleus sp. TaxID=90427 RepID=UPI00320D9FED|nr:type IV pilin N-terminal domain-containing protein [Methanomicrobiaceae archaeon]